MEIYDYLFGYGVHISTAVIQLERREQRSTICHQVLRRPLRSKALSARDPTSDAGFPRVPRYFASPQEWAHFQDINRRERLTPLWAVCRQLYDEITPDSRLVFSFPELRSCSTFLGRCSRLYKRKISRVIVEGVGPLGRYWSPSRAELRGLQELTVYVAKGHKSDLKVLWKRMLCKGHRITFKVY